MQIKISVTINIIGKLDCYWMLCLYIELKLKAAAVVF